MHGSVDGDVHLCMQSDNLSPNQSPNNLGRLQVVIGRNNKQNDELSMRLANSVLRALCLRMAADALLLHQPHIAMLALAHAQLDALDTASKRAAPIWCCQCRRRRVDACPRCARQPPAPAGT